MTAHDRSRELAAAPPQFELTWDEQAELDTHLATCVSCRDWAAAFAADLVAIGALPGVDAPDRVARAVLGERAPGRRGPSRVAIAVAVGVLVVAAAPIAILGLFRGFSSGAAAPPEATTGASGAPPAGSAAPSIAPTEAPPAIAWIRIPPEPGLGATPAPTERPPSPPSGGADSAGGPTSREVTALRAATWLPDRRFVAVGEACPPETSCFTAVATSTDGQAWRRVDETPAVGQPDDGTVYGMRDVVVGGPGLVAVGATTYDEGAPSAAMVWTSPGGRRWKEVEVDYPGTGTWMNAVTTLPDGSLVAVGGVRDGEVVRAAVWMSANGRKWRRIAAGREFDAGDTSPIANGRPVPGMSDVAWVLGQLVAVGSSCDATARCEGVAWTSVDGSSWTLLEPSPFGPGRPVAIAGDDELAIVVGSDLEGKAVWRSVDGETWERDMLESAGPDSELLAVVRSEGGWIAGGTSSPRSAGLWVSSDGLTWSPGEDPGAFLDGTVLGLAADAETVVAVGTAKGALLPMIWAGTLSEEGSP